MAARVVVQQHQGKEVILLVGSESESDGDVEVVEEENLEQEEVVVVVYGRVKGSDPPIWVKREPGQGFVDHADGVEGRGLGEPGAPSTKAPKIIDVNEWFPSTEEEEGGEDGDDDEEEEVEILEPPPAAAAAAAAAAVKAEVEVIEILDDGEEADDEREEGGSTGVASAAPPASPPRPALLPAAGAKVKGKGADKKGKGKAKSSVKREGDGDGEQQQKAAAAAAGAGRKRQRPQPRRPAAEEEEGEEGAAAVAPARSKPAKAAAGKGKKGSSKKCKSSSGRGMLLVTQPLALVRSDEEEGAGEADGEEPTALQLRFKGENLVKISPEYQLEWIRTVQVGHACVCTLQRQWGVCVCAWVCVYVSGHLRQAVVGAAASVGSLSLSRVRLCSPQPPPPPIWQKPRHAIGAEAGPPPPPLQSGRRGRVQQPSPGGLGRAAEGGAADRGAEVRFRMRRARSPFRGFGVVIVGLGGVLKLKRPRLPSPAPTLTHAPNPPAHHTPQAQGRQAGALGARDGEQDAHVPVSEGRRHGLVCSIRADRRTPYHPCHSDPSITHAPAYTHTRAQVRGLHLPAVRRPRPRDARALGALRRKGAAHPQAQPQVEQLPGHLRAHLPPRRDALRVARRLLPRRPRSRRVPAQGRQRLRAPAGHDGAHGLHRGAGPREGPLPDPRAAAGAVVRPGESRRYVCVCMRYRMGWDRIARARPQAL